MKLTSEQRKYLRGLAHHREPVAWMGQKGITQEWIALVRQCLLDHELIKIKLGEFKEDRKTLAPKIAVDTHSELVGLVGHVVILYKPHPDIKKQKIKLTGKKSRKIA